MPIDIPLYLIAAVAIMAWVLFKWFTRPKDEDILAYQKEGALILDVRTPGEFASGSVPGAINIPVQQLENELPEAGKPMLCFCASGARSGSAVNLLKTKGYRAINVGSLSRAQKLLRESGKQ